MNHPNIVAVFEAGQHEGRAYIVSELVEGQPLRAIINGTRPSLRRLIDMAAQIVAIVGRVPLVAAERLGQEAGRERDDALAQGRWHEARGEDARAF